VSGGRGRRGAKRWLSAALTAIVAAAAIALLLTTGAPPRQPVAPTTVTSPATSTSPASVGAPAQPRPVAEVFGANVNRLFDDGLGGHGYSARQIGVLLDALRATGATLARSDTLWEVTEPKPPRDGVHHYDWRFDDSIAGSLAEHGLRWLPTLDYAAPWAKSTLNQLHAPPSSANDYAAYAAAFAARYGPGGAFWRERPGLDAKPIETYEIWNEPDNAEFWYPGPDATQYAELYIRARDAIDAIDPTARVIIGGLTNPGMFLPAMLRARPDLAGHVDGVAIHPYGPNPRVVLERVREARDLLASLELSAVPLYVTEFGWTTHPVGAMSWVTERQRPAYIASTITALGHPHCDVAASLLYTWVTPQRNPSDPQDWYGIDPPNGRMSPSIGAFATALRAAVRPPASGACRLSPSR
jgi:large repetitive protein